MALLTRVPVVGAAVAVAVALGPALPASLGPVVPALRAQQRTQDQVLAEAFPGADISRNTAYLDPADVERARALAGPGVEVETSIVTYYVASEDGEAVGVAYFDAHLVRTLPEVLMVVVGTDDRVRRIETVSFREPPDYRAPDGWLRQYDGRSLEEAELKGDIAMITGATLTARAVGRAVRRVLALHSVIGPFESAGRRRSTEGPPR